MQVAFTAVWRVDVYECQRGLDCLDLGIRARLVGLAPPLKGATDRFLPFPVSPATGLVFSDVAA